MENRYYIETSHDVYADDYNEEEGNHVNFYTLNAIVKAETPKKAIEDYFNNTLYFPFDFAKAYITHKEEGEGETNTNTLQYSCIVDVENENPSDYDIKQWKEGEKELFANNIFLTIHKLTELKL